MTLKFHESLNLIKEWLKRNDIRIYLSKTFKDIKSEKYKERNIKSIVSSLYYGHVINIKDVLCIIRLINFLTFNAELQKECENEELLVFKKEISNTYNFIHT